MKLIIAYICIATASFYIYSFHDIKKAYKDRDFISILGMNTVVLAFWFVLFPFLMPVFIIDWFRARSSQRKLESSKKRFYNAGLYKLFLSKVGLIDESYDLQTEDLSTKFSEFELFAFPVIYDFTILGKDLGKMRSIIENNNIAFLVFYIETYLDKFKKENYNHSYSSLSNTNYSFQPTDNEITASGLAELMNIDNDGVNKIVFVDKQNLNQCYYCSIDTLLVNRGKIRQFHTFCSLVILEKNAYQNIVYFLSLFWTNSKSDVYEDMRKYSSIQRERLYKECEDTNQIHLLNIYKLVEKPKSSLDEIFFNARIEPDTEKEEYEAIYNVILNHSISEVSKAFPSKSIKELVLIKNNKIRTNLDLIQKSENLDFKARIFIKSALGIKGLLEDKSDYSPVVIGYSKFFEREVNLSIVEFIRKELGIEMPTFYGKYCTKQGVYRVREGRFSVDFNKRKKGHLHPPGLGQTIISLGKIRESFFDLENEKIEFINCGKKIVAIRNKCAHPEIVELEDLEQMEYWLAILYSKQVFDKMFDLKSNLSS